MPESPSRSVSFPSRSLGEGRARKMSSRFTVSATTSSRITAIHDAGTSVSAPAGPRTRSREMSLPGSFEPMPTSCASASSVVITRVSGPSSTVSSEIPSACSRSCLRSGGCGTPEVSTRPGGRSLFRPS